VARENKALFDNTDNVPGFTLNTVNIHDQHTEASSYHLFAPEPTDSASQAWVQCVEMYDGYFKRAFHASLPINPSPPHNILCDMQNGKYKIRSVNSNFICSGKQQLKPSSLEARLAIMSNKEP